MQWRGRRASTNVEDRRGMGRGPMIGGGLGLLVIIIISLITGADPRALLDMAGGLGGGGAPVQQGATAPPADEAAQFISVVLADTEDVWHEQFNRIARTYQEPKLVLFTDMVRSACGNASAAVGPFYCPGDQNLYIDLTFYDQLRRRFGAPGDFAQAYVIAHEVGHHVQNLLGFTRKVDDLRGRVSEAELNRASVRLELQADFLAGVWAHHTERVKGVLESGDLEEALKAASAIGDDNIQKQSRGYVVPDSFTHGTSEQRVRWFRKGFQSGDLRQGDTFSASESEL